MIIQIAKEQEGRLSLKTAYLLEKIHSFKFTFHGSEDEDVYGVCILNYAAFPEDLPSGGTLYLAAIEEIAQFSNLSACILFIPALHLSQCYQQIIQIIMQEYKRNAALVRLYDAFSAATTLPKLVEICHQVMQNPVWFLDRTFHIISYSCPGKRRILFPEILKRKAEHLDHNPVIMNANENFPTRHLLAPIYEDGIPGGYLLVFEKDNLFSDAIDMNYAAKICNALESYKNSELLSYRSSPMEQFILNILSGNLTNSAAITQQFLHITESIT